MKIYLFLFIFCISKSAMAQLPTSEHDPWPLHRSQKALSDIIVNDIFSPPVASRIFVYANIAAYEVQVQNNSQFVSLKGQLNSFNGIPKADRKEISYSVAATYAYWQVAKRLVFSDQVALDSLSSILNWYKQKGYPKALIENSISYGKAVSDSVLKWVDQDNYKETRKLRRYSIIKKEGNWAPTPPGYMAAVEPYWNKIRPLVIKTADQFKPVSPPTYSTDKNSAFFLNAKEVYLAGKNLNKNQIEIAKFWDCNPFFLNVNGHMNFATKKISPGAHWISIAGIACKLKSFDYAQSSFAYTSVNIALFDAFISCWDEKYRSNYIRPETFINSHIDENWQPILQTPPFPEYTSGHSVVSTAAAHILTNIFGNNFAFQDDTEIDYGLPIREFSSFNQAANEAAISRLYGGIHYRPAIENGQVQGRGIGAHQAAELVMRRQ
ncbi:vanadium-dependent haloperoxidase [Pedobacter endophyticus]|uniref:Vanadium-dependent haloperoxidase n=1 Tax=Pedobacter endophyticus TaxID=2789740 RepID=A0A7S9Q0U8_9SPHI|nr:vanadium-dependent haloperoxidase [Pedobacter endophyticus]QPH41151.1 vanadium-dependent haloperoxidase [Pedobacter endophyticus]